jgi:hypothetical protein
VSLCVVSVLTALSKQNIKHTFRQKPLTLTTLPDSLLKICSSCAADKPTHGDKMLVLLTMFIFSLTLSFSPGPVNMVIISSGAVHGLERPSHLSPVQR